MSAGWFICPVCGERYYHLFIGTELLSGHACDPSSVIADEDLAKAQEIAIRRGIVQAPD